MMKVLRSLRGMIPLVAVCFSMATLSAGLRLCPPQDHCRGEQRGMVAGGELHIFDEQSPPISCLGVPHGSCHTFPSFTAVPALVLRTNSSNLQGLGKAISAFPGQGVLVADQNKIPPHPPPVLLRSASHYPALFLLNSNLRL